MSETEHPRLYDYDAAAAYCGFCDEADKAYFVGLHKEGRGPSYVKPSSSDIAALKAAVAALQTQVNGILGDVATLKDKVSTLQNQVADIYQQLDTGPPKFGELEIRGASGTAEEVNQLVAGILQGTDKAKD